MAWQFTDYNADADACNCSIALAAYAKPDCTSDLTSPVFSPTGPVSRIFTQERAASVSFARPSGGSVYSPERNPLGHGEGGSGPAWLRFHWHRQYRLWNLYRSWNMSEQWRVSLSSRTATCKGSPANVLRRTTAIGRTKLDRIVLLAFLVTKPLRSKRKSLVCKWPCLGGVGIVAPTNQSFGISDHTRIPFNCVTLKAA